MAGWDLSRYAEVIKWPLAEALASYEARLRESARRDYQTEVLVWSTLAATGATKQRKPPELPAILRD